MSRFLTGTQIKAIFDLGDQGLSPDNSGTSPYEMEPGYVYKNPEILSSEYAAALEAFGLSGPVENYAEYGVTNSAFKDRNGASYTPIANVGQLDPNTGDWGTSPPIGGEARREAWWVWLAAGNDLIENAITLNNINPYPVRVPWSSSNYETYDDYISSRVTLLETLEGTPSDIGELTRLEDDSLSPSGYSSIITDISTGKRFVKDVNPYIDNLTDFKRLYTGVHPTPTFFAFGYKQDGNQQYGYERRYCALRIIIRLYALHNALYGSKLTPLTADRVSVICSLQTVIPKILGNIDAALNYFQEAIDDYPDVVQAALDEGAETQHDELEDLLEDVAEDFTFVESLTTGEISAISQQRVYKKYFATTFNEELITTLPLIQNLYLTEKYFSGIGRTMLPPKRAALAVLLNTINNDEEFQMEPDTSRPAAAAAIRHSSGDFDVDAREFIMRMLIMTPINILKGLVELIDPHVAITKIIKIGSATAFNQGIELLNPVAQEIQQQLDAQGISSNITGQRLMEVVLCFVEAGLLAPLTAVFEDIIPEEILEQGDVMPSVSLEGIDFLGTIPGMFMIPPLPFGLLYLLLELVINALDDDDVLEEAPPPQEC
tara:strand:- start:2391 stop:4199 length:1809 start_codon:yes stop_codon:yes gene_type:complete